MEVLKNKLEVEKLTKRFGNKTILNEISFTLKEGEILSIIGPSGCGKTTLLMTLIGLYNADSGKIIMDGKDLTKTPVDKRHMGLIFQDYSLFENMTVLNNVSYALKFSEDKKMKETRKELAKSMLEMLGMGKHLDKYPSQLSGGERQRVAIARTLVLNPKIILLDEPLSALDAKSKISFRKLLIDLKKKFDSTIIYVTHDQEDAFSMADRIMIMNEGKIIQIDSSKNIINKPKDDFVQEFVVDNLLNRINLLNKIIKINKESKK